MRTEIGLLKNNDGVTITDPEGMVEELGQFFASVYTAEDGDDPLPEDEPTTSYIQDVVILEEDVLEKLKKLRTDKATGVDDLAPRLLHEIRECINVPLTAIFRLALSQGKVPTDWKTANVTPIFKTRNKDDVGNYRPVSLTSQISRMFEGFLKDKITEHLESNKLIKETQHGFRKGKSCLTKSTDIPREVDSGCR